MAATPQDIARAVPPGVYRIDPTRSTVAFTTRHLFGLAPVPNSSTSPHTRRSVSSAN